MPNIGDIIRAKDLQELLEQLNASASGIVGELKYFGFSEIPEHCLACDGSEISRSVYSELFERYGTLYGEGDGSTTFNLPDFRGAFFRAVGGNSESLGVYQTDAIRNIVGYLGPADGTIIAAIASGAFRGNGSTAYQATTGYVTYRPSQIEFNASLVVPTANENRPINFAINVCVVYE